MYKFYYFKKFKDFALDTEDAIISDIEINGNKASIIKEESETRVIMYEENSLFFLGGTLSSEEAYKIMESIP